MKNLTSDQLRAQLHENNCAMNILAEDNEKIINILGARGLKAINRDAALQMEVGLNELLGRWPGGKTCKRNN